MKHIFKPQHIVPNDISADKVYLFMWFLYSYKTPSSTQTLIASLVYESAETCAYDAHFLPRDSVP